MIDLYIKYLLAILLTIFVISIIFILIYFMYYIMLEVRWYSHRLCKKFYERKK